MSGDNRSELHEPVTAWHPMLVALLETFAPAGWKVIPELLLHRLPQRVDILILRQEHETAGTARKLRSIFDHLRPHTLIEHKGPTDDLSADDAMVLLGYAFQYMILAGVRNPDDIGLMVVCDSIPPAFVTQIRILGGSLDKVGTGVWHGAVHTLSLHAVATGEVFQAAPTERLLYAFCRAFLREPAALLPPLDEEERSAYLSLRDHVEQFRRARGNLAMKDEELARKSIQELWAEMLRKTPTEDLDKLLSEDVVRRVSVEKKLAGLSPEERLADLSPEERLLTLPDDALRGLKDEYVHTLSPATQAAIRARIGKQ